VHWSPDSSPDGCPDCRLAASLQRTEEAAKRALSLQHQTDQYGNMMPKAQTTRLLDAERMLKLEMEVSRLEQDNRDLRSKCSEYASCGP
jgi:hypothetical protein